LYDRPKFSTYSAIVEFPGEALGTTSQHRRLRGRGSATSRGSSTWPARPSAARSQLAVLSGVGGGAPPPPPPPLPSVRPAIYPSTLLRHMIHSGHILFDTGARRAAPAHRASTLGAGGARVGDAGVAELHEVPEPARGRAQGPVLRVISQLPNFQRVVLSCRAPPAMRIARRFGVEHGGISIQRRRLCDLGGEGAHQCSQT
jgi:hypothetical protein